MPDNSVFVSVIVVNHNGSAILKECLNALQQQTYSPFEIVVVDNGSTDNSIALIQKNYPDVRLINLERNEGFARAHNIGLEHTLKEEPQIIAFVNTDVALHPDWLLSVLGFMERSGFDLVQALILMYENPERIDSAGIGVSRTLKVYDRLSGQPVRGPKGIEEIFGPCFAAAAVKAHVLQSLQDDHGYLDETFGSFYEDVDFCFRANAKGFKSALLSEPLCHHRRSYTADRHPFLKYFFLGRNYFFILAKHIPTTTLIQNFPVIFLERLNFCFRTITHPRYFCGFVLGSIIGVSRLTGRIFPFKERKKRLVGMMDLVKKIKKGDYE